jgi:parallel beta-helix repeat protein
VASGADLAGVAADQPPGTTFCLVAATFEVRVPIPAEDGDRFLGAPGPDGELLTILTGLDSTEKALVCTCSGGLVGDLIIEHFANPIQQGPTGPALTGWTFDNIESRENLGFGLHLQDDSTLIDSYVHHNHQAGVGGQGDRVLVEGNEIAFNNYLAEVEPGFEAGGSKWVNTDDLVVRANYVHDNCGPGLWTDSNNVGTLYESNTVEDNWGAGIFHEISGAATIRLNLVIGNAFGQDGPICAATGGGGVGGIRVSNSSDVEVYGNVLRDNDGGIAAVEDDREVDFHTVNLHVHDNVVAYRIGHSGCRDTSGTGACYAPESNNRFTNNRYHVGGDRTPFIWEGRETTWREWQGYGHDQTGSIDQVGR